MLGIETGEWRLAQSNPRTACESRTSMFTMVLGLGQLMEHVLRSELIGIRCPSSEVPKLGSMGDTRGI